MEEIMNNNEVMATEEATQFEVVDNQDTRGTYEEPYYPDTNGVSDSNGGPNKVLVVAAVGAALFVGKKLKNKFVDPAIQKRKDKKAKEEKERIIAVLAETGLIQQPAKVEEVKDTEAVATETPVTEVQTAPETPATEEKKEG